MEEKRGIIYKLSGEDTAERWKAAVRETAERRRFHGEIGGKRKENIWTTKKGVDKRWKMW